MLALLIGAVIGAGAAGAAGARAWLMLLVPVVAWLIQVVVGVEPFAAALVLILAVFALPLGYAVGWRVRSRRMGR